MRKGRGMAGVVVQDPLSEPSQYRNDGSGTDEERKKGASIV
jgi:hypothetical protein